MPRSRLGLRRGLSALAPSPGSSWSIAMGTLEGFPNPPAKLRCQQSWQAPHSLPMGTLGGFPNPPAKLRCQQSWQAAHAALSWELWKGFPNPPAKLRCQQSWQAAHAALSWELWKGVPNPPAKLRCQQSWQAAHAALSWELWKGFPNPPAKLRCQQSTATMRHRCRLRQQPFEQRLLRVQAVLRLLPHDAGRPFDNFVSDFLAPVRRQTVQHHGFGVGFAHEFLVEAIADESAPASLHFGFLAHRGEHVGGKHVAARDR